MLERDTVSDVTLANNKKQSIMELLYKCAIVTSETNTLSEHSIIHYILRSCWCWLNVVILIFILLTLIWRPLKPYASVVTPALLPNLMLSWTAQCRLPLPVAVNSINFSLCQLQILITENACVCMLCFCMCTIMYHTYIWACIFCWSIAMHSLCCWKCILFVFNWL